MTGATGFLGSRISPRVFLANPKSELRFLTRPKRGRNVEERAKDLALNAAWQTIHHERIRETKAESLQDAINKLAGDLLNRITAIPGDITQRYFGMSLSQFQDLASWPTHMSSVAASIEFYEPIEEAVANNVRSTETVLLMAEMASRFDHFRLLQHVSTAYVAGKRIWENRKIMESELRHRNLSESLVSELGKKLLTKIFHNIYEQTKGWGEFEIGQVLARIEQTLELEETTEGQVQKRGLPVTIVRPSIIVGDSQSGWVNSFESVLYPSLRLLFLNLLEAVSRIKGKTKLDIVPVDFVAAAISHFLGLEDASAIAGKTFHLTTNPGEAMLLEDMVTKCVEFFRILLEEENKPDMPKFLTHRQFQTALNLRWWGGMLLRPLGLGGKPMSDDLQRQIRTNYDYTHGIADFDTEGARSILEPVAIQPPLLASYLDKIVEFGVGCQFRNSRIPTRNLKWQDG